MSPKFLSKLIEQSEVKAGVLNTYLHRFVIDMTTTVIFRTLEQRGESLFTSETDLSVTIRICTCRLSSRSYFFCWLNISMIEGVRKDETWNL